MKISGRFKATARVQLRTAVIIGLLGAALCARAQTVREAVKEHLQRELEKPKETEKKSVSPTESSEKKAPPEKSESGEKKTQPAGRAPAKHGETFQIGTSELQPAEKEGSKYPLRVIGEDLKIDLILGVGYRGWQPQQYDSVSVDMASYFTWTVDVKAKIYRWINLHRGYYESSGLSGPRTSGAAVAARVGSYSPKAAWLLGVLGFPFLKMWEPTIRYETRAFQTTAKPKGQVCVVTRNQTGNEENCADKSADSVRIVSGFETLVAGVTYNASADASPVVHARKGNIPPIFFGIGLISYSKPYQVIVAGDVLPGYLFDGRFRGAGLAGGTELGGGVNRFYADIYAQFGLGEVELTDNLTLNELAPKGWMIGYVQGDVTVGYRWPVWHFAPTLMLAPELTGGGATFFFFKTWYGENEKASTPGVNWDFLWTARCSMVLSL